LNDTFAIVLQEKFTKNMKKKNGSLAGFHPSLFLFLHLWSSLFLFLFLFLCLFLSFLPFFLSGFVSLSVFQKSLYCTYSGFLRDGKQRKEEIEKIKKIYFA